MSNCSLVAEALRLQVVDFDASGRGSLMSMEQNGSRWSRNFNPLGALVDSHGTVLLEPVHAQNCVVGAEGEHLHVGGELVPLCEPDAGWNDSRADKLGAVSNLDARRTWQRLNAVKAAGELLVDE